MDQLVFKNQDAAAFINTHFVSIKIDGEKGEGPALMRRLRVNGYPSVLLFTPEGTEFERIVGFRGKQAFLQTLQDYLNGKNTLEGSRRDFDSNPGDLGKMIELAPENTG